MPSNWPHCSLLWMGRARGGATVHMWMHMDLGHNLGSCGRGSKAPRAMLPWDYCARSEDTGQCVLMRPQSRLLARVPRPKPFACITNQWSQTAAHPGAELIQGQKALKGWVFARCESVSPYSRELYCGHLQAGGRAGAVMCLRVVQNNCPVVCVGHAVLLTYNYSNERSQRAASWFVQSVTVGVSTIILRPDTADELDCPRVSTSCFLLCLSLAVWRCDVPF